MKRIHIFILGLGIVLVLLIVPVIVVRQSDRFNRVADISQPEVIEDVYVCTTDSDCVIVRNDCCGCENGGSSTSINKEYKSAWDAEKALACQDIACLTVYMCEEGMKPSCVDNKCTIVYE